MSKRCSIPVPLIGCYAPFVRGRPEPDPLVGDTIDFALESDQWPGQFGWVTFRLHEGFYEGQRAYFICADSSDKIFARDNRLAYVPQLKDVLTIRGENGERAFGDLYLFEGVRTRSGRVALPVLSSVPGRPDYNPLWRIHVIHRANAPDILTSVEAIELARQAGEVEVETTEIIVNYPVVKWPGGELPHDTQLERFVGDGQLIGAVNVEHLQVTFKLHTCFSGMRYIDFDASMEQPASRTMTAH